MYKFIKLRHGILIECQGNYMEMIKFNYMLEIDILRNSSPRKVGVLRGAFEGFGCPKRHPDALLAKTLVLVLLAKVAPALEGIILCRNWTPLFHPGFSDT